MCARTQIVWFTVCRALGFVPAFSVLLVRIALRLSSRVYCCRCCVLYISCKVTFPVGGRCAVATSDSACAPVSWAMAHRLLIQSTSSAMMVLSRTLHQCCNQCTMWEGTR